MNPRAVLRSVALAAVVVGPALFWAGVAAAQEADPSTSLSLFPSELTITAGRGEVVERTFGVTQTGQPERELRFEVSGDAASFVSVVDAGDRSTPLESIVVTDTAPAYALIRVAPGPGAPGGEHVARVRLVDPRGSVTVGSELLVRIDVDGTYDFSAELLGVDVVAREVEQGRPVRVRLDVDVTGTAPLVPEVAAAFRGPAGAVHDLVARPQSVEGGERSTIEVTWLTSGWDLGRHDADIVLRSGGSEIGRGAVTVDVVAPGSTEPAVTVLGARLVSSPRAGGLATVLVQARNDGSLDGYVVFAGDLLADTAVLGPVRSASMPVAPGEVVELEVLARVGDPMTYRLRGRANLDGAESSLVSVDIPVRAAGGRPWARYALVGGALVVGLLLVLAIRRSRRANRPTTRGKPSGSGRGTGGPRRPTGSSRPAAPTGSTSGSSSGVRLKVRR